MTADGKPNRVVRHIFAPAGAVAPTTGTVVVTEDPAHRRSSWTTPAGLEWTEPAKTTYETILHNDGIRHPPTLRLIGDLRSAKTQAIRNFGKSEYRGYEIQIRDTAVNKVVACRTVTGFEDMWRPESD